MEAQSAREKAMEKAVAALNATGTPANRDAFRRDINALRAFSVIAVVGYHVQVPGFAGGFVGVDIFLVITGYLMTGKVLNDRFSFMTFLMMRMRRIYPALAVMIAWSIVVGWFVILPASLALGAASYRYVEHRSDCGGISGRRAGCW